MAPYNFETIDLTSCQNSIASLAKFLHFLVWASYVSRIILIISVGFLKIIT